MSEVYGYIVRPKKLRLKHKCFPFFGPRLLGQQRPRAPSKQSRELASGPPSKLPRFPSRCPTGHGEVQTTFVGVNCRAMHV